MVEPGRGVLGELPGQFEEGNSPNLSIAVDVTNLLTFLKEILRGGHLVLVCCCPYGPIEEDGVIQI